MQSKEIATRAFRFAVRIIGVYERMLNRGGAARLLAPQLLRSGTSVGANLEEAAAGQSKADFIAKIAISRKEARETVYWLRLFVAAGLIGAEDVEWETREAMELVAILGAILFNARLSSSRGQN
jgi:four helix bundle protein